MIKSFAVIVCFAATTLLAASAQACGNPGDELLADPMISQSETSAQQAAPKEQWPTEQGGK